MIIRPAQDKDRAELTNLHLAEDIETRTQSSDVHRGGMLSSISSRTRDIVLVAEDDDGELCGYAWAVAFKIFDYRIGLIFDLYVDSKMRHKGYGKELLKQSIDEMHKLGVHKIWANPDKTNTSTLATLEHLGFTLVREKVFYQLADAEARHEWGKE
jgi:L-amino acid N-acyltransferase YncA